MNETTPPLTDQLASLPSIVIVLVLLGFTLLRVALVRVRDNWARTLSETCDTVNFVLVLAYLLIRPFVGQAFYIPSESMERTLLVGDRLVVDKFSYRFGVPQRGDVVVFDAPPIANDGKEGTDFIKRCIGLPGDTVEVHAPKIVINGRDEDTISINGMPPHIYLKAKLNLADTSSLKFFPDHVVIDGKQTMDMAELASRLEHPGDKITLTPGQTLVNGKPLEEPYTREDPDYNLDPVVLKPGEYFMFGDNRNSSKDSHVWGPLDGRRMIGRARVVFWPPARIGVIR